jgi:hypothetical protein
MAGFYHSSLRSSALRVNPSDASSGLGHSSLKDRRPGLTRGVDFDQSCQPLVLRRLPTR